MTRTLLELSSSRRAVRRMLWSRTPLRTTALPAGVVRTSIISTISGSSEEPCFN